MQVGSSCGDIALFDLGCDTFAPIHAASAHVSGAQGPPGAVLAAVFSPAGAGACRVAVAAGQCITLYRVATNLLTGTGLTGS
jgi:hypothetical protein